MVTNTQYLKNKRILITAGPTWAPIDEVRVISNIATGKTGVLLAEKLQRLGARVTLLFNGDSDLFSRNLGKEKIGRCPRINKKIKLMQFKFFDELKSKIIKELKSGQYDVVIHSAAVSDYRPLKIYAHKVKAGIKHWKLNLVPTEKIIDGFRKIDRSLFLAGFKFEPDADKGELIQSARALIRRAGLNLAVANTIKQGRYRAYIVTENKIRGPFSNRDYLARGLIEELGEIPCKN